MLEVPISIFCTNVKETNVGTMTITTERVKMSEMGTTTSTTTSTGITIVIGMTGVFHIFHLKIGNLHLDTIEVVWRGLRICCRN